MADETDTDDGKGGDRGKRVRLNWFADQGREDRDEIIKPHFDEAVKKSKKTPKNFVDDYDY